MRLTSEKDSGYALIVVVIVMSIITLLVSGLLRLEATRARTTHSTLTRSSDYFEAEAGVARAVSWLRQNSQQLVSPYRREQLYAGLRRSSPGAGTNDTAAFTVPTNIKLLDEATSAILTNDPSLAEAAFMPTVDITSNTLFDAASEFADYDTGNALVRITLVEVVAIDPDKDYGAPPNDERATDFYPVYRIDAMTDLGEGAHVYATLTGNLSHLFDYGIYGEDSLEIRQACDSYKSSEGVYSTGIRRANCPAASFSNAAVHKNENIYGTLATNGTIEPEEPYGGDTCADFQPNCPNKGETCAGEECGVPLLEQFQDWPAYCPEDQGDLPVNSDVTLTPAGDLPTENCWGTVSVNTNTKLTLDSTEHPYFFQTLTLRNNSNSKLEILPDDPDGVVELYVETITGDSFNGNQMINASGRPVNFRLYYLGANALTLNGNADMNVALVSPNASVVVSGNFDYSGSLIARELSLQGSGGIHYDEDLGNSGPVNDIQYRVKELVQYYR